MSILPNNAPSYTDPDTLTTTTTPSQAPQGVVMTPEQSKAIGQAVARAQAANPPAPQAPQPANAPAAAPSNVTLNIEGVGNVSVDPSFRQMSAADQDAMVQHIAAQAASGSRGGAWGSGTVTDSTGDQLPGPNTPSDAPAALATVAAQKAKAPPADHSMLTGIESGLLNSVAGIAKGVEGVGNADVAAAPDSWKDALNQQYGVYVNGGLHFTKGPQDARAPELVQALGDWASKKAASLNYSPNVSASDIGNDLSQGNYGTAALDTAKAAGERAVTALPYMNPVGAMAAGMGAYGNTLDARMQNSGEFVPSSTDLTAALAPAVATFAADRLGSAVPSGSLLGAVAQKALVAPAAGAVSGAVSNIASTAGTNAPVDASSVGDAAAEGALGGLGMGLGSGTFQGVGAGIGARRGANAYAADPEGAQSAARVGDLYDAKVQTIANNDPSANPAPFQVFKSIRQDLSGQLQDTANSLKASGTISSDDHQQLKQAISTASRQSYPQGTNDPNNPSGYFDTALDNVQSMSSLPDDTKATLLNSLRDLNTVSTASIDKNNTGPVTKFVSSGLGAELADKLSNPYAVAEMGHYLGGPLGAAAGFIAAPLIGKTISAGAEGIDSAMGNSGPQVLRTAAKVGPYMARNGIDPGNTVSDLQAVQAPLKAQQDAIAQAQATATARAAALGQFNAANGAEPLGGWLATARQNVSGATGQPITGDQFIGHLQDLVDAGHLTQAELDNMSANRGGDLRDRGINPAQFFGMQDYVANKVAQQAQPQPVSPMARLLEQTQAAASPQTTPQGPSGSLGTLPAPSLPPGPSMPIGGTPASPGGDVVSLAALRSRFPQNSVGVPGAADAGSANPVAAAIQRAQLTAASRPPQAAPMPAPQATAAPAAVPATQLRPDQSMAYAAQAAGNQQRVSNALGRVPSYGLAPNDADVVSQALAGIGQVNNRADAQQLVDKAKVMVGSPMAQAALLTEAAPLLAQFRHATPEAAARARKVAP